MFSQQVFILRRYFELWAAFEAVDTGDDHRIDFDEFSKAVTVLEKWNVEIEDPKAEFDAMDSNDGGQALFGEFCAWALKKNLNVPILLLLKMKNNLFVLTFLSIGLELYTNHVRNAEEYKIKIHFK